MEAGGKWIKGKGLMCFSSLRDELHFDRSILQASLHQFGKILSFFFMKISWLVVAFLFLTFGIQVQAVDSSAPIDKQNPQTSPIEAAPYTVKERGSHHRVWERIEYEMGPNGEQRPHLHSVTELATGLHYKNEAGEWQESKEEIQLLPNGAGAAATQGQHKVIFPANLLGGLIELNTPDNKWLRSQVLGLAYFDSSSGKNVLIAELKNCVGNVSGNQVIYENAFTDFKADVRYTYTRAGFEQDIIFRQQPLGPEVYGLDPATTKIQVLTEFFNPPQPTVEVTDLKTRDGDKLPDETLHFGEMSIGHGRAFSQDRPRKDIPVQKQWLKLEGRDFLIEEVQVSSLQEELQLLPAVPAASLKSKSGSISRMASVKRKLPIRKLTKASSSEMKVTQLKSPNRGLVLDYVALTGSLTDYTFKGDTTYYVSSTVNLYGNTTIEGGTVIKFHPTYSIVFLAVQGGTINCNTKPYSPAIFTSRDDNTVGETVSGSTGSPALNHLDSYYLETIGLSSVYLHDLRLSYGNCELTIMNGTADLRNIQFLHSDYPLYVVNSGGVNLRNGLMYDVPQVGFYANGSAIKVENLTVNQCYQLGYNEWSSSLTLTNGLLVAVTNIGNLPWTTNCVAVVGTNSTAFQNVSGGAHYLAANSPYRNAGTTNIDAILLADLKKKTTYPPIAYTNVTFTTAQIFSPQAQRDIDTPDLGYHYDSLDYVFGGCDANSNITFTAGTAVGWFRPSSGWYHAGHGIHLADLQTAAFNGIAENPTYWVRLNTVQEQDLSGGYGPGGISGWAADLAHSPDVVGTFLHCSMLVDPGNHFRDDWGWLNVRAQNCEFYGGSVGGYLISMYLTNCLFNRTQVAQVSGSGPCSVVMRNCTMVGNALVFTPSSSYTPTFSVLDSAFDRVSIQISGPAANSTYATYDYNAYTNTSNPFPVGGSHDQSLTNGFNWQSSWLGNFYLPTNSPIINVGSTNADLLGLYHFTTQTNQVKETNSIVDIGYHYVATDAYGNPIDTDGDGIPDYLEDTNGNGVVNSGEIDWQNALDLGLKVIITRPRSGGSLP